MPITYTDQYLKNLVKTAYEVRATAEVAQIAAFPAYWNDRLIEIRAYILMCMDMTSKEDDPFFVKLAIYRKEWNETLIAAKAALAESGTSTSHPGYFSIPLERG
jgi:hypothetical protein